MALGPRILLGGLVTCCVVPLAHSQVSRLPARSGTLLIVAGDQRWTLTATDLASLTRREVTLTEKSGGKVVLAGPTLWAVMQKVGIPSPQAAGRQRGSTYLRIAGADSQVAVLALAEIDPSFTNAVVLLADRRDGRPLDESEGPWRIVIPDDLRHARWIRQVVIIEVVTAGP